MSNEENKTDLENVPEWKICCKQKAEILDSMDFKNGESTLKILLMKVGMRRYIKFVLNEELEVKPSAFSSPTLAENHFKMIKNYLKPKG